MSKMYTNPWSDADAGSFFHQQKQRYGAGQMVINVPLKAAFLLTNADVGSTKQPLVIDTFIASAGNNADVTAAGATDDVTTSWPQSPTTQSQNPLIEGGKVPVGQELLIGGAQGVVFMGLVRAKAFDVDPSDPAGSWLASAAAADAVNGIQAAFDASVFQLLDNEVILAGVTGHELFGWGSGRVECWGPPTETTDGAVDTMLYSGDYSAKERVGRRFALPVHYDGGGGKIARPQSVMKSRLILPRATAWPIPDGAAMRVEVNLDALWSYNPQNRTVVCEPGDGGDGTGPGYAGGDGNMQRIQPPARW